MYSAKDRKKSIKMTKHTRVLHFFLVAVMVIFLGATAPKVWAGGWGGDWAEPVELEEAEIFFEYNSTDQDLGIQFFLDGEGWKRISIFTPNWRRNVTVSVSGKLGKVGLTEIFSESAEPSLCPEDEEDEEDCDPAEAIEEFLALFPEGEYRFYGWTVDGNLLYGTADLTRDLPIPVVLDINENEFPLGEWESIGWTQPAGGPEIVGYEAVAEMEAVVDDEECEFVNTATLPATATSFTVSREFAELAEAFEDAGALIELKFEVIAREVSGNKTITEVPLFELEEEE